jgi:hypothetical protein
VSICICTRHVGRTFSLANTAPKLYEDGVACDPKANECVTWNAGFIDRLFVRSALPPSKRKFVASVATLHDIRIASPEYI